MADLQIKSRAISGVFWKLAERLGAQSVSMIVSIVLARLLVPEDYSVVSIVAIFFSFCNIFITSGLSTGIVQKKDVDELDYSSVLYFNLLLALVLYCFVFFAAPFVATIYEMEILVPVIRVMGLNFFIYMTKSILSAKVSRTMEFKMFFFATIGGTVLSAIVGILMALRGMGPWALVAQQSINALMDTIILFFTTKIKFVWRFSFKRLKPLINYSWKILATNFIGTIYAEIKPLVVGLQYSTLSLAYYNKAENFPRTISTSLDGTLSAVLFPTIARIQDDKQAVLNCCRRFFKLSSYLIFPAMTGLMAVTESFISVVLTDKWLPIAPFFKIHCVYYSLYFITLGCGQIYKAIGRSDVLLKLEIVKKATSLIILALFVIFSNNVVIFALSSIATLLFILALDSLTLRKYISYALRYQFVDFVYNALLCGIMYIAVRTVGLLEVNVYLSLTLQICVGVLTYLIMSIVTRNENFRYMLNTVNPYINKLLKRTHS